jgi:myo-inositol-1(or 4)-monophosphatase
MAAGVIIVREAGGLIEPLTKGGDILEDGEVICANQQVFDKFAGIIRKG